MNFDGERYFLKLAAAFVRGRCAQGHPMDLPDALRNEPLKDLSEQALVEIFQIGQAADLEMHKFKRTMGLARVRRVFGVLRSFTPEDLLDVGSGRGAFLWPFLDEFPDLPVTAIDEDPIRSRDIQAVRLGGIDALTVHQMDATKLDFPACAFDVVTLLEVLEHIPAVPKALAEAVRVARRFIVLSVPSQPDDNPDHLHLLDQDTLRRLFSDMGVTRVTFDYVPGQPAHHPQPAPRWRGPLQGVGWRSRPPHNPEARGSSPSAPSRPAGSWTGRRSRTSLAGWGRWLAASRTRPGTRKATS